MYPLSPSKENRTDELKARLDLEQGACRPPSALPASALCRDPTSAVCGAGVLLGEDSHNHGMSKGGHTAHGCWGHGGGDNCTVPSQRQQRQSRRGSSGPLPTSLPRPSPKLLSYPPISDQTQWPHSLPWFLHNLKDNSQPPLSQ